VLANARLAARIAKKVHFRGLLFDVEQYHGKLFSYPSQPQRKAHSFTQYRHQVRQRGREFMAAINSDYPDITILLTFGYHKAHYYGNPLDKGGYGLLPAFLDGMLEVAAPNTLIFDGWEFAYGYKREKQFRKAYHRIHKFGLEQTGAREQFRRHYRASFGLWIDYGGKVWDQHRVTNNYFTPDAFEQALRLALRYTDRYVWIYSQKARWWKGKVPQEYIDALAKARQPHSGSSK
jgi:hypothetical protein